MKITRTSQERRAEVERDGDEWPDVPAGPGGRVVLRPESVTLSWTSYDGEPASLRAWVSGRRVLKDGTLSLQHTVEVTYYVPAWLAELAETARKELL